MEKSVEEQNFLEATLEKFDLQAGNAKQFSPLTLAYIGDGVYDLVIRTMTVEQGNAPVNKLHHNVSHLVKAATQAEIIELLQEDLTEEEMAIYKRGRNAKSFTSAKNASIGDYRKATGFEALIGYLYLNREQKRLLDLIKLGIVKFQEKNGGHLC